MRILLKHFTVPALLVVSVAFTVRLKADPTYRENQVRLKADPRYGETQQAAAQTAAAHTFRVFIRGADAGTEEVTLMEAADGWTLRGSGRLRPPINLSIDYWEARYNRQWRPIELTVNLTENNTQWTVRTTFSGTVASTDVGRGGRPERITHTVAVDSLVLPNLVFGSYEALAARLPSATVGSQLQAYIVPQNVVPVAVNGVSDETIQLPGRMIAARRWKLSFGGPAGALDVEVWTEGSRLLRVDIPSQMLSVLRDDIASVSARLVTLARANDEQVSIPANGFSLAATISKPAAESDPQKGHPNAHPTAQSPRGGGPGAGAALGAPAPPAPSTRRSAAMRFPAVVLVSGSSPSDRDEIVAGVPIFAQLATSLADAGFFVVRYDERGNGQSGGRPESATYEDFAADVRAVVTYLSKRRDVDPRKISVIGYGEGGWIALLAGAKENRVATITLIGTPSISGTELVLEQQRQLFERSGTTAGAQQAAVEQQKRILQAVITGKGWDMLTPDMRRRVDTPLYRSFLMFDPAQALSRVRQPMLIVQPSLDREVPPYHGEQLAQLARSRIRARGTDFVQLTGLNHLLTRATTGEVIEYGTLAERSVSPAAVLEISSWLKKTLTAVPVK